MKFEELNILYATANNSYSAERYTVWDNECYKHSKRFHSVCTFKAERVTWAKTTPVLGTGHPKRSSGHPYWSSGHPFVTYKVIRSSECHLQGHPVIRMSPTQVIRSSGHPTWSPTQVIRSSTWSSFWATFLNCVRIPRTPTSVGWSKLDVPSVRPSVRASVRADYNWFYLAAYEGWTHAAQQWDFENPISEKLFKKGSKLAWSL